MIPITHPVLFLNENICRANIRRMAERARTNNISLRPHFKTHQSREIGKWFQEAGIEQITVSSVQMAKYFQDAGWLDITIAFPVNILEWKSILELAKSSHLAVTITSLASIAKIPEVDGSSLSFFIKIDVGTQRTGFLPNDLKNIKDAIRMLCQKGLTFKGFLCHAGHSYQASIPKQIQKVHTESTDKLKTLKQHFQSDYPETILSVGDTPTCSIASNWEDIDEIRPGNFVFYDLMQVQIGSCQKKDIAVALACPVVAKHPDRKTIVMYGGGIHLSKDCMSLDDKTIYGLPVSLHEQGWSTIEDGSYVASLSQEHGVIQAGEVLYPSVSVGDIVGILPVHSCMTADIMKSYTTFSGKKISMMPNQP